MRNRRAILILISLALTVACGKARVAEVPKPRADMQTIDSVTPQPPTANLPPVLTDEGPPITTKSQPGVFADASTPLTERDQQVRAQLPFAPAIAMDPVNGSKVSIRADTPTTENKGKIYYFSSEKNRETFQANPDAYMKGVFSKI